MYLHEYQAKEILKKYDFFLPRSFLFKCLDDIKFIDNFFISEKLVLKAQIHSGSRADAGGIIFVNNNSPDLKKELLLLFNSSISTIQTLGEKKIVEKILIEEFLNFDSSFYISIFIDRLKENIIILFSPNSGTSIENTYENKFFSFSVNLFFGISDYNVRYFLNSLNINFSFFKKVKNFLKKILDIFVSFDLVLLEINPLVLFEDEFFCLDCKIEVDDNSFFRQEYLFSLYDNTQSDLLEFQAKSYGLSYVSFDGNIGCMVNGAGLAMATMDLIRTLNGVPANFLDIGGDATEDRILNAIKIIILNKNVNCIFVNIFGGIVKCDLIAESIIKSYLTLNINIPIVVRFVGNMAIEAEAIIINSKLNILFISDFLSAVRRVVLLSKDLK